MAKNIYVKKWHFQKSSGHLPLECPHVLLVFQACLRLNWAKERPPFRDLQWPQPIEVMMENLVAKYIMQYRLA